MKCWRCEGKGSILEEASNGLGWISKICPVCHGKGEEKISVDDILILVDTQNAFRNQFTEETIAKIKVFLSEYKLKKIIATKFINYPNSFFEKTLDYDNGILLQSQEIVPELRPFVSCVYLKDTYGCVNEGFLGQLKILNQGVLPERVLVAGFNTEACILAIAIGLFDAGIQPCILADFVASSEGFDMHKKGLVMLESLFGMHSILRLG